jgi:hypothetical protein
VLLLFVDFKRVAVPHSSLITAFMTSDRWEEMNRIWDAALEVAEAERPTFVREACRGDEELLRELESLLAYNEQAQQFMNRPAFHSLLRSRALCQRSSGSEGTVRSGRRIAGLSRLRPAATGVSPGGSSFLPPKNLKQCWAQEASKAEKATVLPSGESAFAQPAMEVHRQASRQ